MRDDPALEIARHHVRTARARCKRQTLVVADLRPQGRQTAIAEALLTTFRQSLEAQENGLEGRLTDDAGVGVGDTGRVDQRGRK